ncbi:ATP-binding protein [Antarcticibacterium sp. 1MA-6-2]|uniref:sensor histidine kinase n=1 Tax=Antarcticibacterium sp. 1MA-6-2 TaxID=2908210 RepID=UPI001F48C757|nr:ATP-binding protein [Antarcticibacterium sp. 1MA-6-2]UJH92173.1 ATP-binding protein [Antarcticibacterium sp. 1MA-6-2]
MARDEARTNQHLAVDKEGRVWVATSDKGILRYHIGGDAKISVDTLSTAITSEGMLAVTSLTSSKEGKILVGLDGGILAKFEKDKFKIIYASGDVDVSYNFNSLFHDDIGFIWVQRQNGELLRFTPGSSVPHIIYNGSPSNISSIISLGDGTILVGNGESGITRIDQKTAEVKKTYSRSSGLLSNNVYHALKDEEGNIWIAQSGGVSKLRYNFNAFENFTARSVTGEKPVLPSGKVNTVLISEKSSSPCRFWAGTEGGGAVCVDEYGNSKFITTADGLLGDWVNGITTDSKGRIWIATTQGLSAVVFDEELLPNEAFNVREIDIFGREAFLFSIWQSPPFIASENLKLRDAKKNFSVESLWFLGRRIIYVIVDEEIYELGPTQGLPATRYNSVTMDEEGHLWVGTEDRGLFRSNVILNRQNIPVIATAEKNVFEQVWSLEKGAPTNSIEKLLVYKNKLWMGTQFGLFKMDPTTFEVDDHINSAKGLPADNAVSFAFSPKTGNLWVGTNNGLAEVDPEKGQVLDVVTRQDGLVDNEVWLYGSVKVDENGNVFYGTSNGLSIYHPEKDKPNFVPPRLQLTSAEISYKSDSRNEVTFEYAALSFANVSKVQYKTRLLGYENSWSLPTSVKRLRYTNLPAYLWPKKYTLEVMAVNESGIQATEPLKYEFVVQPVWWLQWWAFLTYIIILGLLVFTIDKIQRRRLIKKERDNARLREAELQAETAIARSNAAESQALALRAENERKALELEKVKELEVAYNELKTTQNQLIQAEKMASLGRLATGVAHEIKNPLNFINNFAELSVDLVEELEEARKNGDEEEVALLMQDLRQNTTKIGEHGKRADAIVKSMMQHARGGKPIFELFDINELVRKYIDLAYQGKRKQLSGIEINIKKDLEPGIGEIKVVGQEIGQVLINVIGNSLDAVVDKKKKLQNNYDPFIKIMTRKSASYVEIIIADNGPGIPEEIRERIFEPFFTTKPTGEGTGLGLSLSYNIIKGHNGSLKLINNETEGATFIIALPVLRDHPTKKILVK